MDNNDRKLVLESADGQFGYVMAKPWDVYLRGVRRGRSGHRLALTCYA
ncbi:MAG: hypothetical protein R2856_28180 [Caldilineaceae bacterium]